MKRNLSLHLDGARLFNALVARKEKPAQYGKLFHSISVCFNKGLGCPMGSVLLGTADFIHQARRVRKVFGGGLRQAGFAGSYCFVCPGTSCGKACGRSCTCETNRRCAQQIIPGQIRCSGRNQPGYFRVDRRTGSKNIRR